MGILVMAIGGIGVIALIVLLLFSGDSKPKNKDDDWKKHL